MSERDPRFPAKFPVVLRKGPDLFPATICNISHGGGCILGSQAFEKGATILLDYAVGQTRATVVWQMARMTGLRFENRLSPSGLARIRTVAEPA